MPRPTDETEKLTDPNVDKAVVEPIDTVKNKTETRRLIIATLPNFKRRQTEKS
jgi:hypothetical protein